MGSPGPQELAKPRFRRGPGPLTGRVLTEPGLAERLSRQARASAERFHWGHILPQWEALLDRAVRPCQVKARPDE